MAFLDDFDPWKQATIGPDGQQMPLTGSPPEGTMYGPQQGDNSPGYASNMGNLLPVANGITRAETSPGTPDNGYFQRGPLVTSGRYAGENALGRYQIMPGNLPEWSQRALGYNVTPQQLVDPVNGPRLQDMIFQDQASRNVQQYGPQGAANVWFSGRPNPSPSTNDVYNSVKTYQGNFAAGYNNTTPMNTMSKTDFDKMATDFHPNSAAMQQPQIPKEQAAQAQEDATPGRDTLTPADRSAKKPAEEGADWAKIAEELHKNAADASKSRTQPPPLIPLPKRPGSKVVWK